MRKLLLLAVLGLFSLAAQPAKAQVSVSVNIGTQPQWGPRGYDYVDYYYLPEIESYYYVPTRQFVYYSGNRWIHAKRLPSRYRNYDLYGGRKVVINSPRPWMHHNNYRTRYVSNNYNRRSQRTVYNNGPSSYHNSPSRNHKVYRKQNFNNGRGNGHYKNDKPNRDHNDRGRGNDHNRGGGRGHH